MAVKLLPLRRSISALKIVFGAIFLTILASSGARAAGVLLSSYAGSPDPISAADAAAGSNGYVYIDTSVTLSANESLSANWLGVGGILTLGGYNLAFMTFSSPPTIQSFTQNGSGKVTIFKQSCASPQWWGADPTDNADSTGAFNAAITATGSVCVPPGIYNIAGTVVVKNGQSLVLDATADLHRHSSGATTPVLECLYIGTTCSGGTINDNSDSPNGIVVLGDINNSDISNAWWWRLTNMTIQGASNNGDISIFVPSGQLTNNSTANYFGTISDVNVYGGDIGLLLAEYADAETIHNLNFWNNGTYAIEVRGAYANKISDIYVHVGASNGLIGIAFTDPISGSFYSTHNMVTNFGDESGGSNDKTFNFSADACKNTFIGMVNTNYVGSTGCSTNFVEYNGIVGPYNLGVSNLIIVPGGVSPVLSTSSAVTSGAGSGAGTLTNAPSAGNPTKWIPFNDNGVVRYIPAW